MYGRSAQPAKGYAVAIKLPCIASMLLASPQCCERRIRGQCMRLLGFEDLKARGITYCRDHLRRLGKQGKFPKPIKLGGSRRIAFVEQEVDQYLAQQVAARDQAEQ
jgi:prophage regulatory protein